MRPVGVILCCTIFFTSYYSSARAGVVTFTDLNTFLEAAGDVQEIDFETLPDGSPSFFQAEITPEFNYTDQGVEFFSHEPDLFISGNDISGFNLRAGPVGSEGPRNWIIAEMVEPATAVGILFPGITILLIDDVDGRRIGGWVFGGSDDAFFGVISDQPIVTAIIDRGSESATIDSFYFTPVPEPTSLLLLGAGALVLLRRRK